MYILVWFAINKVVFFHSLDDADEEGDHGANGAGNGNDQPMDES